MIATYACGTTKCREPATTKSGPTTRLNMPADDDARWTTDLGDQLLRTEPHELRVRPRGVCRQQPNLAAPFRPRGRTSLASRPHRRGARSHGGGGCANRRGVTRPDRLWQVVIAE